MYLKLGGRFRDLSRVTWGKTGEVMVDFVFLSAVFYFISHYVWPEGPWQSTAVKHIFPNSYPRPVSIHAVAVSSRPSGAPLSPFPQSR